MNSISKKIMVITPLLSFQYFFMYAQIYTHRLEAGINGGAFIYTGDLARGDLGSYATIRPQFGFHAAYILNRSFSLMANFSFGSLRGDDSKYTTPAYRQQRNFKFTTPVTEFSGMFAWDIFRKNALEQSRGFAPYIFAGAGISLLNVQRDYSQYNASYFDAETTGAGLATDAVHRTPVLLPIIPVGAGLKYFISPKLAVKAETNYRFMSTDYLDGFSRSANPAKKDNYYSFSLGVVLALGYRDRNDCPPVRP
ncbi:MAG: hypothetical protein IT249_13660 [Chitinophagaceae bacterium]|nr:hypothetical protein [Chitinophagaceae bacterium]